MLNAWSSQAWHRSTRPNVKECIRRAGGDKQEFACGRGRRDGSEPRPRDDAWFSAFPVIDETLAWDEAGEVGFGEGAEGIGGVARPVVERFIAGEARGIGGLVIGFECGEAAVALRGAEDHAGEEAAGVLDADPDIRRAAEGAGIGEPGLEGGGGETFPCAFLRGGIVRQEVVAEGRTAEGG